VDPHIYCLIRLLAIVLQLSNGKTSGFGSQRTRVLVNERRGNMENSIKGEIKWDDREGYMGAA
jgi:hypothetical protein